jgi:hypothetical protein
MRIRVHLLNARGKACGDVGAARVKVSQSYQKTPRPYWERGVLSVHHDLPGVYPSITADFTIGLRRVSR